MSEPTPRKANHDAGDIVPAAAAAAAAAAAGAGAGAAAALASASASGSMPHAVTAAVPTADINDAVLAAGTDLILGDPWQSLRRLTQARIATGRSGVSATTKAQLAFQLAHAQARDAVHAELDIVALTESLRALGQDCVSVHSAAAARHMYLQRPDLGRQLDDASRAELRVAAGAASGGEGVSSQRAQDGVDLAVVIADGLSARAIAQNAQPFLQLLLARLGEEQWTLAPVTIASQGRVAIGDEVGALLKARAVLVLIGERPGLSSPDSMGLYLSWAPRVGMTDADRNCISNVRPAGLSYAAAVDKLMYLLTEARRRGLSGVALKEEAPEGGAASIERAPNFLLG